MTVISQRFAFYPSGQANPFLSDFLFLPSSQQYQSGLTPGAAVLGTPIISEQINQQATVLAVGVQAQLQCAGGLGGIVGRLSKILGGVLLPTDPNAGRSGLAIPNNANGLESGGVIDPLPNPNLLFPIWDPVTDPLPPATSAGNPLLISGTLQLPQSIPLLPGEPPTIALCILPSLVGNNLPNSKTYELDVWNPLYTITYDDGIS